MSFFHRNVAFEPPLRMSAWRKTALAIWRTTYDPSIYGVIELEAEPVLAYLEKIRLQSGARITLTHFVGKAVGTMLERHPELNTTLRRGRIYPRQGVNLTFTVASDGTGSDLGAFTLRDIQNKSVVEIAREMEPAIREVKEKADPHHRGFKTIISFFPNWLAQKILACATWIQYDLNLWSPLFGLPRDPYGAALITNIGSLGLDLAFGALIPATRMSMVVSVGALQDRPVVRQGKVVAGKTICLAFTIDHRVIDAVPAGYMAKTFKKIFADPERELSRS